MNTSKNTKSQDKSKSDLFNRLMQLPHFYYEDLKKAFYQHAHGNSKWSKIKNGVQDFQYKDYLFFSQYTGFSLDELSDPSTDLLQCYILHQNDKKAKKYGLAVPKNS